MGREALNQARELAAAVAAGGTAAPSGRTGDGSIGANALIDVSKAGSNAGVSGSTRGFWTWEQFGLILVPAAWMLISMVPNCMTLAYAYLPHAHRVQTGAVRHALRAHHSQLDQPGLRRARHELLL